MNQTIRQTIQQKKESVTQQYRALVQGERSAERVAFAFAVGTFISLLPTPGLNVVMASMLASRFKQLDRIPLFAALGVWNNLVVAPLYGVCRQLGALVLAAVQAGGSVVANSWVQTFVVGNLLLAVTLTLVSYIGVQVMLAWIRPNRVPAA